MSYCRYRHDWLHGLITMKQHQRFIVKFAKQDANLYIEHSILSIVHARLGCFSRILLLGLLFLSFPFKEQLKAVQGLERDVASYKPQMDELELVNQVSERAIIINNDNYLKRYSCTTLSSGILLNIP